MSKKYVIKITHEDGEYLWNVFETATEQTIVSYYFEEDADKLANFMEKGGAFDGFTPAFFLVDVNPKEEVNQSFSRVFT